MTSRLRISLLAALSVVSSAVFAFDSDEANALLRSESWVKPPEPLLSAIMAPWHENWTTGSIDPTNSRMLITRDEGTIPLERLGRSHMILGGLALDMRAARSRSLTIRSDTHFLIVDLRTGKKSEIQPPKGVRVSNPTWSPDGMLIAYIGLTPDETSLMIGDVVSGKSRKLTDDVRWTYNTSFQWSADGKSIFTTVRPNASNAMSMRGGVPSSPLVRVGNMRAESLRTYASLLQGPEEAELLENMITSQVGKIDVRSGKVDRIGGPGMINSIDAAPDGSGFIVSTTRKPFSYLRPVSSFPRAVELWDATGQVKHTLVAPRAQGAGEDDLMDEGQARPGGQRAGAAGGNGIRAYTWRPDGAGLAYLQMAPATREPNAKRMDRVMLWQAPFEKGKEEMVWQSETSIGSVDYSVDAKTLFSNQTIEGKSTLSVVNLSDSEAKPVKLLERPTGDDAFYKNPGSLVMATAPNRQRYVLMTDNTAYLSGTQYDKNPLEKAPRSFIDQMSLEDGKLTRVFYSKEDMVENAQLLGSRGVNVLMTRQSPTMVPQSYIVNIKSGAELQLSNNKDYLPQVSQAETKKFMVERVDGFKFQVTVTLPRYAVGPQPAMFWFYPTEYVDQKSYDQSLRTYDKNRFVQTRASSVSLVTTMGYVYVDTDFPIVGPSEAPNNTFASQLRNNLDAVINKLADERIIDRTRLAIGGHSYGAFGTANALIHTPYFKAGIAGDGNYNRSLTPFGFQREPRTIWQTREVYQDISAIWHADKMNGALLMYHGMEDQNMGTEPSHSPRLYQALEALGKPTAMYMYPFEDHGQVAIETRLDMWARWISWLEVWVKNPGTFKKTVEPVEKDDDGDGGLFSDYLPKVILN